MGGAIPRLQARLIQADASPRGQELSTPQVFVGSGVWGLLLKEGGNQELWHEGGPWFQLRLLERKAGREGCLALSSVPPEKSPEAEDRGSDPVSFPARLEAGMWGSGSVPTRET